MDKEKRFWVAYLLFCFAVFGLIAGGVYYDFSHVGFDPITHSNPELRSFFAFNGGNCHSYVLQTNLITFSSSMNDSIVPERFCG